MTSIRAPTHPARPTEWKYCPVSFGQVAPDSNANHSHNRTHLVDNAFAVCRHITAVYADQFLSEVLAEFEAASYLDVHCESATGRNGYGPLWGEWGLI